MVFFKKAVFRNCTKFTGKHLCYHHFFIKLQAFRPVNFVNVLRIPFLQNIFGRLHLLLYRNFLERIFSTGKTKKVFLISRGYYLKSINNKRNTKSKRKFLKQTRLVFSQFLDLHGNLGN